MVLVQLLRILNQSILNQHKLLVLLMMGVLRVGPTFNISIPLSAFKNTILALDKDLYLNEIIVLRIVWNAGKIEFVS